MTSVHYWGSASSIFFQRQLWQHYFLLVVLILVSPFYSLAQTMGFTTTITLLLLACVTFDRHLLDYITILERPGSLLQPYVSSILAMQVNQQ